MLLMIIYVLIIVATISVRKFNHYKWLRIYTRGFIHFFIHKIHILLFTSIKFNKIHVHSTIAQNSAKSVLFSSEGFLEVGFGRPQGLFRTAPISGSGSSGCTRSGLTMPWTILWVHFQNWEQFWTILGIHLIPLPEQRQIYHCDLVLNIHKYSQYCLLS